MKPRRVRLRQRVGELLYRCGYARPHAGSLNVLMYHAVTQEAERDDSQMSVPAALFARHMAILREQRIEVLPLDEGVRRAVAGQLTTPAASVVFDDGFVGVHDCALEVLVRFGIPATVFLVTSWVERPSFPSMDARLGRPLTWAEVRSMAATGQCAIGSHTDTHPVLTRLADEELHRELRRSMETVTEHVGLAPVAFAYPYGSYGAFDRRTRAAIEEEGYRVACTTVWGRHGHREDPLTVKRIRMSWVDTDNELRKSLTGCYDWYRWVQRGQHAVGAAARA